MVRLKRKQRIKITKNEIILNILNQLNLEQENTIGNIKKEIKNCDSTIRNFLNQLLKEGMVTKVLRQEVKRRGKTYKFHCLVKKRNGYCYFITEKGLKLRNSLLEEQNEGNKV